jgi:hypothetical protein
MFGRFFKQFHSTTIEDPAFGTLTNDKYGNWSGRIMFDPLKKEIDVIVRLNSESPPTPAHREFLDQITERWPAIFENLRKTLFEDLEDWEDGTTMKQLFDSLDFNAFSFWDLDARPRSWEIGATTPLDDHIFGIVMRDFEHEGFRMDG